eukprot:504471_1
MGCCHIKECEMNKISMDGSKTIFFLTSGYIRKKIKGNHIIIDDIICLICKMHGTLEMFMSSWDDCRESKVERTAAGTMTSECGNIFREIECFEENGYDSGVRYLSIKFVRGGCTNHFGITSDSARMKEFEFEVTRFQIDEYAMYRPLKEAGVYAYCMPFKDYDIEHYRDKYGIITIKLDCDNWYVAFYKDYKQLLMKVNIERDVSYFFYMYYCNRADQLFEIVWTDINTIEHIHLPDDNFLRFSDF